MVPTIQYEWKIPDLVPDQFFEAFKPYAQLALRELRGEIAQRLHVGASGDLRRSLFPPGNALAEGVTMEQGFIKAAVSIPDGTPGAKYAQFVEEGRGPGKMPPWGIGSDLYKWMQTIQRTGARLAGNKNPKFSRALHKNEEAHAFKSVVGGEIVTSHMMGRTGKGLQLTDAGREALTASYLIARAIGRNGTKAQHPFALGFEAALPNCQRIIEKGVAIALEQISVPV